MDSNPPQANQRSARTGEFAVFQGLIRPGIGRIFLCFSLGVLSAFAAKVLGLDSIGVLSWTLANPLITGLVCASLGLGRVWPVTVVYTSAIWLLVVIAATTSLNGALTEDLIRDDPLRKVDAIIVLSANISDQGIPSHRSLRRLDHAYKILDFAPRLILTRMYPPTPSYIPYVEKQLSAAGLHASILEVGPVADTHDEAIAVTSFMRAKGWKSIILVSDPAHMKRAAALFRAAGVEVICSPNYSKAGYLKAISPPHSKARDFGAWFYEWYNFRVARAHGWI